MSQNEKDFTVLELQARWDRIRAANLYDTLDKMGYGNQCLDLGIRPLFPHQHIAGKAVTVRGGRDPRTREEVEAETKDTANMIRIKDVLFPGAVVVVDGGGEPYQPRADAGGQLLRRAQLGVGGRRGVDHQRAHVADVGDVAVQLERVDERLAGLDAAGQLEREAGPGTLGRQLLSALVP